MVTLPKNNNNKKLQTYNHIGKIWTACLQFSEFSTENKLNELSHWIFQTIKRLVEARPQTVVLIEVRNCATKFVKECLSFVKST